MRSIRDIMYIMLGRVLTCPPRVLRIRSRLRPQRLSNPGRAARRTARRHAPDYVEWRARVRIAGVLHYPERNARYLQLAGRSRGGAWKTLGRDLKPEFEVTSGRRRLSEQQIRRSVNSASPSRPNSSNASSGMPSGMRPSTYLASRGPISTCPVSPKRFAAPPPRTTHLPAGEDRWRPPGSEYPRPLDGHLLRHLAVHRLPGDQPAAAGGDRQDRRALVAYKYDAGLQGFSIDGDTRVRLAGRRPAPGSSTSSADAVNTDPVALRARNRLALVETGGGSIAVLPAARTSSSSRAKSN